MPILSVIILRRVVDAAVGAASGTAPVEQALLWIMILLVASLAQSLLALATQWIGHDIQERLKARVQERVLLTSGALPLSDLERDERHDQLHRAQRGLDNSLFNTMDSVLQIPTGVVTVVSLLIYVSTAGIFFPLALLLGTAGATLARISLTRMKHMMERGHTAPERLRASLAGLMTQRQSAAEIRLLAIELWRDSREAVYGGLRREIRGSDSS